MSPAPSPRFLCQLLSLYFTKPLFFYLFIHFFYSFWIIITAQSYNTHNASSNQSSLFSLGLIYVQQSHAKSSVAIVKKQLKLVNMAPRTRERKDRRGMKQLPASERILFCCLHVWSSLKMLLPHCHWSCSPWFNSGRCTDLFSTSPRRVYYAPTSRSPPSASLLQWRPGLWKFTLPESGNGVRLNINKSQPHYFSLEGGREGGMPELVRAGDWIIFPVGPLATWSSVATQSFRQTCSGTDWLKPIL